MSLHKFIPLTLATLILVAILASGCTNVPALTPVTTPVTTDLKKFNSTAEIEQYIRDSLANDHTVGTGGGWWMPAAGEDYNLQTRNP